MHSVLEFMGSLGSNAADFSLLLNAAFKDKSLEKRDINTTTLALGKTRRQTKPGSENGPNFHAPLEKLVAAFGNCFEVITKQNCPKAS